MIPNMSWRGPCHCPRAAGVVALMLATLCGWFGRGALAQTVTIHVPAAQVEVSGEVVRIADVATLDCPSSQVAARLAGLELERFPPGTDELVISSEQLLWRMALAGHPADDLHLQGPARFTVRRVTREQTMAAIGRWLAERLAGQAGLPADSLSVSLSSGQDTARLCQRWNQAAGLAKVLRAPPRITTGTMSLLVETAGDDGQRGLIGIIAEVRLADPAPLMASRIGTGPGDAGIRLVSADEPAVSRGEQPPAANPEIRGATLRQAPGAPFASPVIRSGAPVSVIFRNGPLSITLPNARALAAGAVGETIPVQNMSTRRQMLGRILDGDTVELVLPMAGQ